MKWQNFTKSALLAFLLCSVSWTESLEIITEMLPSFIRIGQNITLTCIFESTIHIELRYLYVKWSREGQVVITFHSGHIEVNRTGAELFTSVLETGNASLFLPDVGIADEGEYQCYVLAPSSDKTASLKLQVAAPPHIITSEDMTYASNDQNSVLSCDAMNFYPAELDISWKMVSEEEQIERGRRADMWKQGPILTPAGTYNIKTLLPLEVQEKDIQVKYICRIIHERSEMYMEKIIHVQHVHVFPLKAISIFGIVFGSIVATIILGAAFHTFYKFCGNVSPELRELDGPVKDVKHGEEVKLSWQVNRYRPKDIEFEIFKGNQSLSFENKCADKDEEAVPLLPPKYKIEKSSPVQEASRLFSCKIDVSFTADILQDNNEIFLCELNHKALIKPIEKSIQLKVNGVPPEMDNIISPSAIFIGEPVVLTCTVSGYKPAPLVLTWFRQSNGENNSIVNWCQQDYYSNYSTSLMQMTPKLKNVGIEGERRGNYSHTATVLTHNDSSYTVTSNVTFIAQPMTKLVEYICKIFHPPTKHTEEKRITITNQDLLYLSSIWHHPVTMSALQPVILTCKVGNLYQRNVNIMWYKNRKFLKAEKLEAIAVNPNSFVLELELIPTSEDQLSQISCVIHDPDQHFTKESRCRLYLQAPPKMHPIECTPELPIPGNQVQLSCKATGFWPSDITYLWLEEGPSSQGTEWKNTCREHLGLPYCSPVGEQCKILSKLTPRPEIDKESLCSATSELIIVPCELDNYKKYRFVAFQPTTNQLFSKSFILNLKGFPAISSIECSPPEPVEGQPVTLRCRLLGFPSNKLSIQWCRDSEVLTEGISNTIPITNSDCLFGMETQLHINQLQPRDAKCKYICHVSHGTDWLSSRSIILQLQAHPILSSIRSEPAIPVLGQQIKIFCEIEGPITKYTSTWFKNGWEYKGAVITEKVEEEGISTIRGCIQFPATADNHMSEFRYQIQDEDGKHIEMRYFTLFIPGVPEFDQASAPVIYAEIGKELQLTCNVGNAPCEDIRFFWFCQGKQIKRGICVTSPMISPKTEGTFQITTMLKFTVTEKYHCNQFICQIHHPDLQTPIEKSFIVKIKDFPYFLGYVGSTSPCREGISTTLQFSINAMPEDTDKNELCVTWLKNEEQLNNVSLENPCSKRILSKVKLIPSVSDHNMKFVCHLEHSCLKQPLETFHRFALQGRPRLVDTSVEPQVLIVDKTAVINCIIASPDRKVSFHWEKDGTEITDGISSYSCMPFDWKLRRVQNKQFHTTESDKVLYRIELIFTPRDADVQLEYKFIVKHHDLGCCVEETFRLQAQRTEADFSVKKDAELPLPPIDVYATIHKEPNENVKEIIFRMKAESTGNL